MNKVVFSLLALAVASATSLAQAQAPAPAVSAAAPAASAVATPIEAKVAMCIGCHGIPGYQSSFPEVHKVPMISGQNAKYIAAALQAYKTGARKHPTMRGIAEGLSDQDVTAIAAYYEGHGKPAGATARAVREPGPQVAALLQKAACASCHGADFSKPIDPSYPKIAGQHADYLYVALRAYKMSANASVGRNNGVMAPIVGQFSNAELKALANYVGSLQGDLVVKPDSRFR